MMMFLTMLMITTTVAVATPVQNVEAASKPVLEHGDREGFVWSLQDRLQQLDLYNAKVDGIFGPITEKAVIRFQQRNGLIVDGIVGPQTWGALETTTFTKEEKHMLAKLVHGEARGETFEGKVAVASVVLNRLESDKFPNTISGIIFESGAFTAVADKQYYLKPNGDAHRAVDYAIRGWDPSEGALFYFNPKTATSDWIWSREQIKQIDKHIFAK